MAETRGGPVHGTDVTGADTYVALIAAAGGNRLYRRLVASVDTKAALLSFDAGTTEHVCVPITGPLVMHDVRISGAIHGKNETAGQNYANLHVTVW
jgi:hypothetical protein